MQGIYIITNTQNNKSYIGQSIHIAQRWTEHIYAAKQFKKTNKHNKLYDAINKYGITNFQFSILEECIDSSVLDEREIYWIAYYDSYNNGYNSTRGGQGPGQAQQVDEKWIYNLWDEGLSSKEIQYITGYGKTTVYFHLKEYSNYSTEESKKRGYRQSSLIKLASININNNYSFSSIGWTIHQSIPIYQYDLFGNYITMYSSITQAEQKYATSIGDTSIRKCVEKNPRNKTAYGYQWSREKVDKMPVVARPRAKIVKCINTGELFPCAADASERYKICRSNITSCCNGSMKSAGKHPITKEPMKWEYV